jgi:vitamin B12 transporter
MLGPALLALPVRVAAQGAEEQVLPPIVVQGATLEAPPARPRPRPRPAVGDGPPATTQAAPQGGAGEGGEPAAGEPAAGDAAGPAAATGEAVAGVPAERVGSAVTVVTSEELRAQQIRHAADALRSLPGVSVSRGSGFGGVTDVRVRGGEANHTLVLIDGIELNDPTTGAFDFSNLLADDIERIEVIRGPQSGLYGSNALAGVVNIITKSGRGPLTLTGATEAGAFGTRDVATRLSGGTDQAWVSIAHHWRKVEDFNVAPVGDEEDPVRFNQLSMRAGAKVMDGVVLDLTLRKIRKDGHRDGFDAPDGSLATAFDDASTFTSDILAAGVNLRWDTSDGRFTHILRASHLDSTVIDNDTSFFFRSNNEGETLKYGYLATYRFATPMFAAARHSLTGLIEEQDEGFTPRSDFADGNQRQRAQLALVGEWRGEFADRLFLTSAVRHDDNDVFADFTTWRSTAALAIPEWYVRPHASVGTGVKLPTMFEQFGFFGLFRPNPDLQPEESLGWDAGLEFTLFGGRAFLDVTYFDQNLENKIRTTVTGAVNIPGESTREGVEVAARWRLTPELTLGGAYTLLDAVDADGLLEARRARHSGRVDLNYIPGDGRARFNVTALYNGRARDDAFRVLFHEFGFPALSPESVFLDDYLLLSAAASYKVRPGMELFGRVENILDQDYQEVFGFATPGVAAYAGVRFTYEEPTTASWAAYK